MAVSSVVGEILIGWIIADAMTGVFHYWQDHGREKWPLIGKFLISPAVLHHRKPQAFTNGGFLYRNLATFIGVLAVASVWLALLGPSFMLASATAGGMLSTQAHYWAHRPSLAPGFVRTLQQIGVLQSPKGHALHHRPPHTESYCALTDWLNPLIKYCRRSFLSR